METFRKIIYRLVAGMIFVVLCFLLVQGFFTEIKLDGRETLYFVVSNKFIVLTGTVVFILAFALWHRKIKLSDKTMKRLIIAMSVINILFILGSQNIPRSDQGRVIKAASEILQGNYNSFMQGNYMGMYPHQNGQVLFCYFLFKLFGTENFLVFQVINALAVGYSYYFIYRYWKKYTQDGRADEVLLGIFLFFPVTMYVNYVYGMLIGLMLTVCAVLYQQMYFRDRDRKNLVLSVVMVLLANMLKSNYIIFVAGILLLYAADMLFHKEGRKRSGVGIAGLLIGLVLAQGMVSKSLGIITDGASDGIKGMPKMVWIVMGVQHDGKYGWFNEYAGVYEENNYDYEKTQDVCMEDLKEEIQYKLDYPQESVDFFRKKITSIWCEPSFGAFFENRIDFRTVLTHHSRFYNDVFSYTGRMHRLLGLWLKIYQNIVYLGAVLYLVYSRKDYEVARLAGMIIFFGGFLFHLFWEAKSSYAFIYFVLLIPYAVIGLGRCCDKVFDGAKEDGEDRNGMVWLKAVAFCAFVACSSMLAINKDNGNWNMFLGEHLFIDDGYYYLQPESAGGPAEVGGKNKWYLSIDMSDAWQYEFEDMEKEKSIAVVDGEICMLDAGQEEGISKTCGRWRIQRENGAYCIRWWDDMNKVMTYDEGRKTIYISDYQEGNKSQLWELKR